MSQSDGFIEEVTEELRRDRLFATMRRWGWVAILAVILLVGGAAVREWRLSRAQMEAEARGDALLAAVEAGNADAALAVGGQGAAAVVAALLGAALGEDPAPLEAVAADPELPPRYRDLAVLKLAMADAEAPAEERRARLEAIAGPGAPYRLLAEEQLALLDVEAGEEGAALERLEAILADAETTAALRERARQLVVALGGALDAA